MGTVPKQSLGLACISRGTIMATAAIVKAEDDSSSSSPCDLTAIGKMSAGELHQEIIQTYVALGENAVMYQALVLQARERMHRGEQIGDCSTWKEYADKYLRRDGESLPTCLRRLARAIEGSNPAADQHDGSDNRKGKGRKADEALAKKGQPEPPQQPATKPTLEQWRQQKLSAGKYSRKYFTEAANYFVYSVGKASGAAAFKKALTYMGKPECADDLAALAQMVGLAA